ncbi:hypothetical protein NZK33_10050 [Cyanobium sp. FGCU-6]|jgi:hypothetical protein|nr:hypothetical protein [Cyanobium sp. FGCU6]
MTSPIPVPDTATEAPALSARIAAAAAHAGIAEATLRERWLLEGIERFEAQHGLEGSGRCSMRTGTRTVGPVPLPVQQ